MKLTRESLLWTIGVVTAVIAGLATLDASAAHAVGLPAAILPYLRLYALVAGLASAWMKTSPFPSKNDPPAGSVSTSRLPPAAMILLAVGLGAIAGTTTACAKKAPATSPVVLSAVKATEVVHALDVVRDVAVTLNAEQPPVISAKTLQIVVAAHRSIVSVIGAAPNGWKATAEAALTQLQKDLPLADAQRLGPYLALVQALVDAFVPASAPDPAIPWTVRASLAIDDGLR